MSAAPIVPPRPSRAHDVPKVPPRPINRRLDRSASPNRDRFAPSPLNESPLFSKSPRAGLGAENGYMSANPIDRAASVDLPSVGEEGKEYAAVAEELSSSREASASPEQTRTVGDDIKLFAPKPSLPAHSAKQRVMAVTRTDSDKAASFGIGKPSSEEIVASNRSLKKKASTTSQLSTSESQIDDEHGIPEIGLQVPMYPNAGDVQAPSPAPLSGITEGLKKHHHRKTSARGFADLPPGSYGLHGHGVLSRDKLDADYYSKHPELVKKEHHLHHYDRPNDCSMSSEELNKIVRETPHRSGPNDIPGTPGEHIGWQAIEETTSRISSPLPESVSGKPESQVTSPLKKSFKADRAFSPAGAAEDGDTIHVDEPGRRKSVMFTDDEAGSSNDDEDNQYNAPILASDEVAKDPKSYELLPAVEPPPERRGSAFEIEEPHSRPTSRPASIYKESSFEMRSTPLEDVKEYEPLFPEDEKHAKKEAAPPKKSDEHKKPRFPSRDIWEDAPNSVHFTAEVSTPDVAEQQQQEKQDLDIPTRDGETPAQAFARHQEELAEKEARDPVHRKGPSSGGGSWAKHQPHLAQEVVAASRPAPVQRFPSRDVWEDAPDSHILEATVETPQQDETSETKQPSIPQRPAKKHSDPSSVSSEKPSIPERPKPKQTPSEENVARPAVPDKPKPQVPARPAKQLSGSDKDAEAAGPRSKPAVPARPMGGKIAALQAGFMSDLNKRLQLGPQAPKKEEPVAQDLTEEKEKAPLSDARKGRARGPQRRAPRTSPSPAAALNVPAETSAPSLGFSFSTTMYSIDPDSGTLNLSEKAADEEPPTEEAKTETLASNMAGETVVEAKVEEDAETQTVEPTEVEEVAKD